MSAIYNSYRELEMDGIFNLRAVVMRYFHPLILSPLGENITWYIQPGVKKS